MASPIYRLHAAFDGGVLALWCETGLRRPESIAPAKDPAAIAGVGPPAEVERILSGVRLVHKVEVRAPVSGTWRRAKVPGKYLAAGAALRVLELAAAEDAGSWAGPDLRVLGQLAAGVRELVGQAQVVPVVRVEESFVARWELVRSPEILSWLGSVSRLVGIMEAEEIAAFADWVADAEVRRRSLARPSMPAFVKALVGEDPELAGNHPMVARSRDFATHAGAANVHVVFRVLEPTEELWRIQVLVRIGAEGIRPFSELDDPELVAPVLVGILRTAEIAFPPLAGAETAEGGVDYLVPGDAVVELVSGGAAALQERGIEVLLPRAWTRVRTEVRAAPAVAPVESEARLGLRQLGEIKWEILVGGETVDDTELQRMVAASSDLVQLRGRWVRAEAGALRRAAAFLEKARAREAGEAEADAVDGAKADGKDGAGSRTAIGRFVESIMAEEAEGVVVHAPDTLAWEIPSPESLLRDLPPWFAASLRDYQAEGVRWLHGMAAAGLGAVLADDMGLGKTVQLLALESVERHRGEHGDRPTLVVAPLSLVRNWAGEAARFAPELSVLVHHGPGRLDEDEAAMAVRESDLVLTTYGTAVRDIELLGELDFRRVVVDEAQTIKNIDAQAAKALRLLRSDQRVALTGTPVENRLEDMRAILDYCNPRMFGSAEVFRSRFSTPIETSGDTDTAARLVSLAAPFILRRTKNDPGVVELPAKLEYRVDAYLTAEQAALYKAVVEEMLAEVKDASGAGRKGAILSGLTALKQVCDHPSLYAADGSPLLRGGEHRSGKLAALDEILTTAGDAGEKVLVFTQYRTFGDMILPFLGRRAGEPIPFLSGLTSASERARMVSEFQRPDGPPIFLASLRAGGTGLTLTAANHVVHLDRWWNPAVEDQATDRVHRIGQERDVNVYTLVAPGTVEERIADVLDHKQGLRELTVGSLGLGTLSDDALADLVALRGDSEATRSAYRASVVPHPELRRRSRV
ncbi:DEAD/DEAH box helicase [Dietzia sp.]|uniref:DEAD/DEAH box helicase n=1 Tax=Dietzia sp. TaxID=1871616 RepID=UPI002FDADEED